MLKAELPPEVNILTIEPVIQEKDTLTVLFRVEHIYDRDEHSKFSKPVSIPIDVSSIEHERHIPIAKKNFFFKKIFLRHQLLEAKEVTLGGNMYKSESFNRLKWTLDSPNSKKKQIFLSLRKSSVCFFRQFQSTRRKLNVRWTNH